MKNLIVVSCAVFSLCVVADPLRVSERLAYSPNDADCRGADDSSSIQRAVDAASASGVGKVVVPAWNARTGKPGWMISRSILLPGAMTVVLDGCRLTLATGVYENFFRSANAWTEKGRTPAGELRDIRIVGVGNAVLDGGEANDLCEATGCKDGRPHVRRNIPILFVNVREFAVTGLKVVAHRYWGMCFCHCRYGRLADLRFVAGYDRRNQDGINLRNGCSEIVIENISGQTGDDMIALSAIDVPRTDGWSCLVEGRDDDIHDVSIRNVTGAAVGHPLVALRNNNGAQLYNIAIENVSDTAFADPCLGTDRNRYALVRIGNGVYWSKRRSEMGETRNISVRNLSARYSDLGIVVNTRLCDSTFANIVCSGPCRTAISTMGPVWAGPGAAMRNVLIDHVTVRNGEIFDFRQILPEERIEDVVLRDCTVQRDDGCETVERKEIDHEGPAAIRLTDGVSEPFQACARNPYVYWKGHRPGKSEIRISFASAPDVGGRPGAWSDFVPAVSTSNVVSNAEGWLKYRVELIPDGDLRPKLQLVQCGDIVHVKWRREYEIGQRL